MALIAGGTWRLRRERGGEGGSGIGGLNGFFFIASTVGRWTIKSFGIFVVFNVSTFFVFVSHR